jgi:sugar lactone lactonase YvrE
LKRLLVGACTALTATVLVCTPAAAKPHVTRPQLTVGLFARVPSPGLPEAIAVAKNGTVYVGTNQQGKGDAHAPSRIFAYSKRGDLIRQYVIAGQNLDRPHGIQGIAIDGEGLLYALDSSADPRVITIDPKTGQQRDYARFRDVPTCSGAGRSEDCSDTATDRESFPNFPAFAPDGSLYVTDTRQALIWRVPPGGGEPEVFFTDRRLDSGIGPNGIQVMPDGRTLMFAVTFLSPLAGDPVAGALYTLPIEPGGGPGEPKEFWRSRDGDAPDGFAIGRSGNVYVALALANQLAVVSPQGEELARVPSSDESAQLEVPFDAPASVAFSKKSVLVTNQSLLAPNPEHWAVLQIEVGEHGAPLFSPRISRAAGAR